MYTFLLKLLYNWLNTSNIKTFHLILMYPILWIRSQLHTKVKFMKCVNAWNNRPLASMECMGRQHCQLHLCCVIPQGKYSKLIPKLIANFMANDLYYILKNELLYQTSCWNFFYKWHFIFKCHNFVRPRLIGEVGKL